MISCCGLFLNIPSSDSSSAWLLEEDSESVMPGFQLDPEDEEDSEDSEEEEDSEDSEEDDDFVAVLISEKLRPGPYCDIKPLSLYKIGVLYKGLRGDVYVQSGALI
jgi:hypothetical protein